MALSGQQELELQKLQLANARLGLWLGLVRYFIGALVLVSGWYIMFWGLKFLVGQDASQLSAFARIIAAFHIKDICYFVIIGALGVAVRLERNGKKRALEKKAYFQALVEKNDPFRSTSGI